jgi:hypothetical protein
MLGDGRNAGSASIKTNASRGASAHLNDGQDMHQEAADELVGVECHHGISLRVIEAVTPLASPCEKRSHLYKMCTSMY